MIELTVVRGPGKGTSITLTPDRSAMIGSGVESEIRVGGDDVAAEQVVVKALKGGGFGAKGIAGPFLLNGRATEAARLRDGDVITVGDTDLRCDDAGTGNTPRKIGGFRLLGVLGRGGWGVVWRAEQISLGREVALKVLSEERLADPLFVGRFQAEARNAARLHHPNVVQVFDVDHEGDTWFYSMELMHGGSLERRLKREGELPVEAAIRAIHDAARGLAFAEQMRIVHRDIKPDNLMVDRHGHVKIADLGLAMTDDDDDPKLVGTPHFMSPEQVRKQPLDHRSDLYSLGCTFYRLVTGRTPFQGDTVKQILRAHLDQEADPADQVTDQVPPAVGQTIARLMAKDPEQRHQSAQELIEDLETLLAPASRPGVWVAIATTVVVVAAAVVAFVILNRPDPQEPTTVVEYVNDPEAQRALEENRRIAADNALLRVKTQRLTGLALADALDAVAAEHPDTPASEQATEQAAEIRAEVQRAAEAEVRHTARVEAAIAALRTAFDAAMTGGDLRAAAGALAGGPSDADLADAATLKKARGEMQRQLDAEAAASLAGLRTTIDAADRARDAAAVREAVDRLEALLGPQGWPDSLLVDRPALARLAVEKRARADAIDQEHATEAENAAWKTLRDAVFASGGVSAQLAELRFAAAANALEQAAGPLDGRAAATRATALVPGLRAAERYVAALETTADAELKLVDPRDGQRVVVASFDRNTGLTIERGPRNHLEEEQVPIDVLVRDAGGWFPVLADAPPAERIAFLGALAFGSHLRAARECLGNLRPDDDQSGTDAAGYPASTGGLQELPDALKSTGETWAEPFVAELRATSLVARGLTALATRRNLTAAGLVDRALSDHGDTLFIRCLR